MANGPDGRQTFLPVASQNVARRRVLALGAVFFAGVVLLIGQLTVPGRLWWASDQERSKQVFDVGLRHDVLATTADWIGHLTIPTVLRVVTLICAVLLWRRGMRYLALWWAVTMVISGAVAIGLRYVVARPRPDWPGSGPVVEGYTFPSGHATNAAVFAGCILVVGWPYLGRAGRVATAVAGLVFFIVVGASRVVLGVHCISDVVAAWAVAATLLLGMVAIGAEPRVRNLARAKLGVRPELVEPGARAAGPAPRPGLRGS